MIRTSHRHTLRASYIGYITQAIVNNFCPLLFLTFQREFGLSLGQITLITTVNFAVQLLIDFLSTLFVDRIGYRKCIVAAHVFAAAGLAGLTCFPAFFPTPYAGLMTAVVLYGIGGGLIEVLISPIVESCPTEGKAAAMSLLHSFYCWGQAGLVFFSALFFRAIGIAHWRVLALLWALVPLLNTFYFALVPIYPVVPENVKAIPLSQLLRRKTFWLLMVLMVCAGASELAMSQWSSAFAEAGLRVSKTVGDLAGPCAFALCMGTARALYGHFAARLPLRTAMVGSAALCAVCYALAAFSASPALSLAGCALCGFSVGIFWPGTFSMAAEALPGGGTAMYALMALAGDVGCSGGPTLVGLIADAGPGLKAALPVGIAFAAGIMALVPLLRRRKTH